MMRQPIGALCSFAAAVLLSACIAESPAETSEEVSQVSEGATESSGNVEFDLAPKQGRRVPLNYGSLYTRFWQVFCPNNSGGVYFHIYRGDGYDYGAWTLESGFRQVTFPGYNNRYMYITNFSSVLSTHCYVSWW